MKQLSDLFRELPPTLILAAHFGEEELRQLRRTLEDHACVVTSSIFKAKLAITKLTQEKRVRREINELARTQGGDSPLATNDIEVVKEKWIHKCIDEGKLVDWPFENSTWRVTQIPAIQPISPPKRVRSQSGEFAVPGMPASKRPSLSRTRSDLRDQKRPSVLSAASFESASAGDASSRRFHAASQTSTNASSGGEEDQFDFHNVFSCRRKTPLISRNEDFVKLLTEIRLARELALFILYFDRANGSDQIGVRAYSSAIATLKAYPHKLTDPSTISKLPGCGSKIVSIYKEYLRTGTFSEYIHLQNSSEFQTLKLFWGVWGVGAHTARQWYFDKGWRNLDDIIEGGWDTLPRVQQIGIKYYEEFNEHKIPRSEVEEIGRIVGDACQAVAAGTVCEICGGYRRGKSESGDVDIIISNPTPRSTQNLCFGLVKVLEERGIISHTLTISNATSKREENQKHSFRQRPSLGSGETRGYGLDSLDKALVVILLPKDNPHYTGIHRRVDLIIAPWRAWGTAIVGWTVCNLMFAR